MSESLIVFNQDYPAFVFVLAILLLVGLLIREWIRENPSRKFLRVFCAVLVGVSLMAIIFRPQVRRSLDKSNLIVLTAGYDQTRLDSLKRAVPRANVKRQDSTSNSYGQLDEYGAIYVLGEGIPEYDLWQFANQPTQFLGGQSTSGLTRINYPALTEKERKLTIKGEFLTNQENLKLFLEGPEGQLDSAIVGAGQPMFELAFVPKTVGNFIYTISDEAGSFSEKVPLIVQPSQKLKVLMINAFPTFETRYLKSYLARRGNEVVVRNQVSTGIYRTEFYNTPQLTINRLTKDFIEAHDVLIMDLSSLEALNNAEKRLLNDAIQNEGVGLFIQPEEAIFSKTQWLSIERIPTDEEVVSANLAGTAVTLARYPFQLRKSDYQLNLLEDDETLFALAERNGLGKIGTTLLKDTYRQNLTGDSLVYANIWSEILNGLAKQNPESTTLMAQNAVVYPLEPYQFELQNPISPNLKIGAIDIPLRQNPDIPERWQGTYWAKAAGWQEMVVATDTIPFYTHEAGQWQSRRAHDRIGANQQFFAKQEAQNTTELFQHKAIPVLWFYLVFLLSAGFLWFEPKV